jgi:hypothetical protein
MCIYLDFKITQEENNINYLDLPIHRHQNNLYLEIYAKPTQTGTTIDFISNHPLEHALAVYFFHMNRTITLPVTEQTKQHEWNIMLTINRNNGFSLQIIHNSKENKCLKHIKQKPHPHKHNKRNNR